MEKEEKCRQKENRVERGRKREREKERNSVDRVRKNGKVNEKIKKNENILIEWRAPIPRAL